MSKSQEKRQKKKKVKEFTENIADKVDELKINLEDKTKEIKEEIKEIAEDIINDVKNHSKKFDKKDIEENKAMAVLSYILPPIPYFIENKSKWVKYHAIQGMNLFIIFIILSIIISLINSLILFNFGYLQLLLRTLLNLFGAILAIIGIINVCNCEAKELPLINKIKLIKR